MNLSKSTQNDIKKLLGNVTKGIHAVNELKPLWNLELKHNKISNKELLDEFDNLLRSNEDVKKIITHCFDKKGRAKIAQYIADVDYTLNSGTFIINKGKSRTSKTSRKSRTIRSSKGKTKGGDDSDENSLVVVERREKKAFFNFSFCVSLLSILTGILLIYLAIENLNALSETYALNINFVDIFTNFKATIESLPGALMKSISKEAMHDIEYRVRRGCMSASSNTVTDAIGAYINAEDTMTCMMEGTMDGIRNTVQINSLQLKNGILLCHKLTVAGVSMITGGGTYVLARLVGSRGTLSIKDSSSRRAIMRGGNKTKKRRNNIRIYYKK
jgi:hypothetical protein